MPAEPKERGRPGALSHGDRAALSGSPPAPPQPRVVQPQPLWRCAGPQQPQELPPPGAGERPWPRCVTGRETGDRGASAHFRGPGQGSALSWAFPAPRGIPGGPGPGASGPCTPAAGQSQAGSPHLARSGQRPCQQEEKRPAPAGRGGNCPSPRRHGVGPGGSGEGTRGCWAPRPRIPGRH